MKKLFIIAALVLGTTFVTAQDMDMTDMKMDSMGMDMKMDKECMNSVCMAKEMNMKMDMDMVMMDCKMMKASLMETNMMLTKKVNMLRMYKRHAGMVISKRQMKRLQAMIDREVMAMGMMPPMK